MHKKQQIARENICFQIEKKRLEFKFQRWVLAPTRVPIIANWQTSVYFMIQGNTSANRENERSFVYVFATSGCYTHQRLGKKKSVPGECWQSWWIHLKKRKKLFKVLFRFFHHMIYQKIINIYFSFHPMY